MRASVFTCACMLLAAARALAQGPANVLVVINQNSSESREIGEYYARRRGVPAANICRIRASTQETIARAEYESRIAGPVANCLRGGQLRDHALYIVTTAGVPLRISGALGKTGDGAAVDSELTLLYQDRARRRHPLAGIVPNPFFRQSETPFQHPRFPIYLVTRLAAYDVAGAKALVDRALAARNRGKFVIDLDARGDHDGNVWLRNAAILLPAGRLVFEETGKVLYGVKDVVGYAGWGSNDKTRHERFLGFRWLPGAIVTDFVSSSGRTFRRPPASWKLGTWSDKNTWFADSPQSLTADYLSEGATGASGHVYEPYLQLAPRPDYLLPAWYAGRNLAEAYYMSIPALSWQNIVVGDPLCSLGPP
ncbi:MAG: TIGR03790 family protein [Acidobacteria bacterium]|nr:TIGR03790 family protein [Acidobacteriota bacterium]